MNIFNRIIMILLLFFILISSIVIVVNIFNNLFEWSDIFNRILASRENTNVYIAALIFLAIIIICIVILFFEFYRRKIRTTNVASVKDGKAKITLRSVSQQIEEDLEDIAIVTEGRVISEEIGVKMENVTLDMLGKARQVKVEKENTTIVEGKGSLEAIKGRIKQIKNEIEQSDSDFDKEKLQERMAKLSGGVAVVKVGAATEVELKEKKHRIEDALSATKAAVEEGIVPGGGVVLVNAIPKIDLSKFTGDIKTGASIVVKALEEPLRQIAVNAGYEGSVVVEKVKNLPLGEGLDALEGKYVNMIDAGIIDPAKVTRSALQNAASIAALMLTTEVIVAEKPEMEKTPPIPPGGPGGYPEY